MSVQEAPRLASYVCLLAALAELCGCTSFLTASTADVAGIASAGITSGVTKNAALGTGIGLGVAAGANAGLHYVERQVHHTEQDAIADAAGPLQIGQVASWRVVHTLPIEANQHGQVTVFRVASAPGFNCKQIIFSIENEKNQPQRFYTTSICFNGERWEWALAEPSTARWDGLQ
jgi:hypothetical protein